MDHENDQATLLFRLSDLPQPDVRIYCDDDVVRSLNGEWQIGDAESPRLAMSLVSTGGPSLPISTELVQGRPTLQCGSE